MILHFSRHLLLLDFLKALSFLSLFFLINNALAQEEEYSLDEDFLPTITVEGRSYSLLEQAASASVGVVGKEQFQTRPILRPGELLEVVPGLVVTQHSGDGKANQFFFRGFNLDHGTDFATTLEGMPVNMRSHGHGQGYTDINFIIPELIDFVEYKKGVYYAEEGDFASAGAAHFKLANRLEQGIGSVTVGDDGYYRGLLADSYQLGSGDLLVGSELFFYDGPWDEPNNLKKINGVMRYTIKSGKSDFSLLALAYNNNWDATDQIASRAVEQGLIGRFGNLDPDLGGNTNRYSLSANWNKDDEDSRQKAALYAIYYDLDLFSNFTYFLDDPVNGDEFEQVDRRVVIGGNIESEHDFKMLDVNQAVALGMQYRTDFINEVGLHKTADRNRLSSVRNDEVDQSSVSTYLRHEGKWFEKFRTVSGLRGDLYWFDVNANTDSNSGNEFDGIVSPKLNLIFGPWNKTEIYTSGGYGFHSNDARGVTIQVDPGTGEPINKVDPLVRSKGAEVGLRTEAIKGLNSTLALWGLELDSELVFVGDAGNTESSSKSKRLGVELNNFYKPWEWMSLDLDYSFSRSRFAENTEAGDRIPGALEHVITSGVAFDTGPIDNKDDAIFGSFRVRYFAPYSLIEDNSQRADDSVLANLRLGYRYKKLSLALEIFNLFDSNDSDIQYFYPSRLEGEPAEGVEDVHFHPFQPRQLRVTATMKF